jgi:isopentenyl phosphate kinase
MGSKAGGLTKMQLLKLGGSVITVKNQPFTADTENIKRLCREIASSDLIPEVIVHGGGSYGHPTAKKHLIAEGFRHSEQLNGFSITHQSMVELNRIIVDCLMDAGVHAFALSPSSFIITKEGRMLNSNLEIVKRCIDIGLTPVLYGDAVLDSIKGFTILSGDQLIVQLAQQLNATRVIMGCNVDGVYTSDPLLDDNAELIPVLHIDELNEKVKLSEALNTDVTGGMMGKVKEAKNAVKAGIDVIFVNAKVSGRIRTALQGEKVVGTIMTR